MTQNSLTLAQHKTEAVLLPGKRRPKPVLFKIQGTVVKTVKAVNYLGVVIDERLTFAHHFKMVTEKAGRTTGALSRLMPNIGGPSQGKRKILSSVMQNILLYAAPIWAEAAQSKYNKTTLVRTQRKMALRIVCAYRTVSAEAALVLAGLMPIHILAQERMVLHKARGDDTTKETNREQSFKKWQSEWDNTPNASWTRRLIKDIKPWVTRRHGHLNYHTTQFLTEHGNFGVYTLRIGKTLHDLCRYCQAKDTAEHTAFRCCRWEKLRFELNLQLGEDITTENIINKMTESNSNWSSINTYLTTILRKKEKDERDARCTLLNP
ncbi:hypothetical protein R5R35_001341 [Gryllus longicercus]|uniref:Reverse transcriptase n=1 Tax=Gryllus longicercus TaxID=2509291 RepID=A0AAN9VG67_9ORTH